MDALEKRVLLSDTFSIPRIPVAKATSKLKKAKDISYTCIKFLFECVRPYDNRVYVAGLYGRKIAKINWEIVQNPIKDSKNYQNNLTRRFQRVTDKVVSYIAEALKKPLCKTTAINGFLYALFTLNYSKEKGFHWNSE